MLDVRELLGFYWRTADGVRYDGGLLMELWTDGSEGCGLDLEVVRSVGWIKKKTTHLWVGGLGDGGGLRSTISIE